jgi:cob(I)alamin adenosyltransferase
MKIYTKKGDSGETALFGGERVPKDDLRLEAYGTVDELNSIIGIVLAETANKETVEILTQVQNDLFTLGSDLASPLDKENKNFVIPRTNKDKIEKLETFIDSIEYKLPELRSFILPGGCKSASFLQLARTVCRRGERRVVSLAKKVDIGPNPVVYLNRLSDLLFVLSRFENLSSNHPDIEWKKD